MMTFPTIYPSNLSFSLTNSAQHGPGTISQKNGDFWPPKKGKEQVFDLLKNILEKAAVELQVRRKKNWSSSRILKGFFAEVMVIMFLGL